MSSRRPRSVAALDLSVLALVVPVLIGLHVAVPASIRRTALGASASESFLSVAAAAYLHLSVGHLLANVAFYALYVAVGYALARAVGRERWFGLSVGACLLVTPAVTAVAVVKVVSVLGMHPRRVVVGFSGVASAVVGVFFVAWLLVICTRYRRRTTFLLGWLGLAVVLGYLLVVTGADLPAVERTLVRSFVLFPLGALLVRLGDDAFDSTPRPGAASWRDRAAAWRERIASAAPLVGGFLCSAVTVAVTLFPTGLLRESALSALVHGLGFVTGLAAALVVLLLLGDG